MMTKDEIREHIFSLADDAYREFHSRLVPGEEKLVGVRVPVLRAYAKELYAASGGYADALISVIGDEYYEEIMLQGMIIGLQKKAEPEQLFAQIDKFVPKITNWGVCDTFCAGLKQTKKYPEKMYDFLQKYLCSDAEFEIRFGVVMLLDYYITDEYLERIFAAAQAITHDGYYVKMAVAWLISMCFVKFYEETKEFMQKCTLDDFTYNKALQKARESLRLTKEQKEDLKGMKR